MITAVRVYDHIINGHEQSYQSRTVMACRRGESARARAKATSRVLISLFSLNEVKMTSCGIFRSRRLMIAVSHSRPRESNAFSSRLIFSNHSSVGLRGSRLSRRVKTFKLFSTCNKAQRMIPDESQLRIRARKLTCLILIERIKWFIHAC